MNSAIERLLTLRVADVMNRAVITVHQTATMAQAACLLRDHEITGAPVVDGAGRCVGVLSNSDFAMRESTRSEAAMTAGERNRILLRTSPDDPYHEESLWDDRVESHMSPVIQTLSPQAPLMNAARSMCNQHIHRLIIVDENQRPVGIVSSLDVVAAVVAAIEE